MAKHQSNPSTKLSETPSPAQAQHPDSDRGAFLVSIARFPPGLVPWYRLMRGPLFLALTIGLFVGFLFDFMKGADPLQRGLGGLALLLLVYCPFIWAHLRRLPDAEIELHENSFAYSLRGRRIEVFFHSIARIEFQAHNGIERLVRIEDCSGGRYWLPLDMLGRAPFLSQLERKRPDLATDQQFDRLAAEAERIRAVWILIEESFGGHKPLKNRFRSAVRLIPAFSLITFLTFLLATGLFAQTPIGPGTYVKICALILVMATSHYAFWTLFVILGTIAVSFPKRTETQPSREPRQSAGPFEARLEHGRDWIHRLQRLRTLAFALSMVALTVWVLVSWLAPKTSTPQTELSSVEQPAVSEVENQGEPTLEKSQSHAPSVDPSTR